MIATLRGPVSAIAVDSVVIEVGGVGLAVRVNPAALTDLHIGREAALSTSLVVREDSLTLYGFSTGEERDLFEALQAASGVGPRLALAVLSVLAPPVLRRALAGGDLATLMKVPGVGRKGAERLVVELRDRLPPAGPAVAEAAAGDEPDGFVSVERDAQAEAQAGLVELGYSAREAEEAVTAARVEPGADTAAVLRAALAVRRR